MGRSSGTGAGSKEPSAAKFRKDTGRHHAHTQRKAVLDVHERAIARKQRFPWQQMLLIAISFMSFCTLLYLYLNWLAADDDEELMAQAQQGAAEAS